MTMLYSLHLSKPVRGFGKPSVRTYPAPAITGHLDPDGDIVVPHYNEVWQALPAQYRMAFDRSGAQFWYDKNDNTKPCSLTLRDCRGRYLNTLYALPYVYAPAVAA